MAFYELIEAYNSKGMGLNRPILKHIAHRDGIPHTTIHLWIQTKEGIILQQRSKNKDTYPLYWDVSVAGHIDYNESPPKAAQREAKEELGILIDPDKLIELGRCYEVHYHPKSKVMDREFKTVYYYKCYGAIDQFNIQEEEVESVALVSLDELQQSIDNNTPYVMVPHKKAYFKTVLEHLSK